MHMQLEHLVCVNVYMYMYAVEVFTMMTCKFLLTLSQGLRIAPPEAPVTGYMFGKGVYFADMVSKSANYCSTSRSDNEGLMLLCEVALGDM